MPDKSTDTTDTTPTMRADKVARRAAALRDNLAKRKSQQRARTELHPNPEPQKD
jgi:hypothetical protein